MWNAVLLEGQWYAVDVTWNDTSDKLDRYLLVGESALSKDHIEDGVISSSGFELDYPALKPYNYGTDSDENGMDIKGETHDDGKGGKVVTLSVSYDGKGAKKLREDGKYLVVRMGYKMDDGTIYWIPWYDFTLCAEVVFEGAFRYDDAKSYVDFHSGVQFVQFALLDYAADVSMGKYPNKPEYGANAGKPCYCVYDEENLTESHFIAQPSTPFENEGHGEYIPSPYAAKVTPVNTGALNVNKTYLSMSDFKDENGNYYAENQRSQLILVADKPTPKQEKEMHDTLVEKTEFGESDIISSATYEISLNICGIIQSIPKGTYMQVAFGFPEGFSPDDAGTTFKIYHYKRGNDGKITGVEEIPVIVTEYGLIARVASFSPFTVVQVKKSAVTASNKKYVYANVSGKGGTITNSGMNEVGASITYTLTADTGYEVAGVMLNGKTLAANRYAGGTLTLQNAELEAGNTLDVTFVTASSAQAYRTRGVEIIQPDLMIVSAQEIAQSFAAPGSNGGLKPWAIVLICILVAAIAAGCAVAVIFILKKKKAN